MKSLLQFLLRYSNFLLMVLLEIAAMLLIINHNRFQQSSFLTTANIISGSIYEGVESVVGYFNLKNENKYLTEENIHLKEQINLLENRVEQYKTDSIEQTYIYTNKEVSFLPAKVVNLTSKQQRNYITLNRGERDGVYEDMAVVNKDGLIGVINSSSDKYSLVIPIINPLLSVSAKFKNSGYIGTISWDGKDYRYANLNDIARHLIVNEGDSIVSSGLSEIFPENIPIGVIEKATLKDSDPYYNIKVRLSVDFRKLNYVTIIKNDNYIEQHLLEEEINEIGK